METLYLLYKDSICPKCSDMIKQMSSTEYYKCNDCKTSYKIVGLGDADKEITVEIVSKEKTNE